MEMESTWLVQRLERPRPSGFLLGKDNPFSFGGGLKNGGLSDEAMDLLRGIWAFDYMGAGEFEFGAVPNALSRIAKSNLGAFWFSIELRDVRANYRDRSKAVPEGEATVYVICPSDLRAEVEQRIRDLAADAVRLKEATRFPEALRPLEEWDEEHCGWLEIDNGFLFFTDEEMWRKAAALFGLEVE